MTYDSFGNAPAQPSVVLCQHQISKAMQGPAPDSITLACSSRMHIKDFCELQDSWECQPGM